MTESIVIAGASGFIGQYLTHTLRAEGARVSTIGRRGADAAWGDTAAITDLLDGSDLLVNLAGKSVNCRYTPENRAEIVRSRVDTTRELGAAIESCDDPPGLWVNSSTATIYRHAEDRGMTESTGELGTGFSVEVAKAWEAALFERDLPNTRRVALRMAIVLGDGSALVPLVRLARFGLGGPQLDGRWFSSRSRREAGTFHGFRARGGAQRFSWVHIDDVVGIVRFLQRDETLDGPINASAPNPSDSRSLMSLIRGEVHAPVGVPAPRWMLELGSALIKTETELVLKSRWVLPERLLAAGYHFAQPDLGPALHDILTPELGSEASDVRRR